MRVFYRYNEYNEGKNNDQQLSSTTFSSCDGNCFLWKKKWSVNAISAREITVLQSIHLAKVTNDVICVIEIKDSWIMIRYHIRSTSTDGNRIF